MSEYSDHPNIFSARIRTWIRVNGFNFLRVIELLFPVTVWTTQVEEDEEERNESLVKDGEDPSDHELLEEDGDEIVSMDEGKSGDEWLVPDDADEERLE